MLTQPRRLVSLVALCLAPVILSFFAYRHVAANQASPASAVAEALAQTRATASYHVSAEVQQTVAGQAAGASRATTDKVTLRVEGDVVQPSGQGDVVPNARLNLITNRNTPTLELRLVDGKAYIGNAGKWQLVENPLGATAPDGDYLGYLAAVANVTALAPTKTAGGRLSRYSFSIDGPTYARQQLERTEKRLAGQIPQNIRLQPSARLAAMSGQGELWVDAEGRARREILNLTLPGVDGEPDAHVAMTIDFSRFGDHVPPILAPVAGPDGALTLPSDDGRRTKDDSQSAPSVESFVLRPSSFGALVLALFAALCLVLIHRRRHRLVYGAVVITVTVSMVVAPVANVGLMALFQARLAQAASMNHALADLGLGSEGSSKKEEGSPSLPSSFLLPPSSPALNAAGTATDLEDCRTLYPPKDKGGYDPNEDLDQDGLGNQTEWCLGTDFKKADTDADGITDTLELAGYNAVYTPTVGSPTMTHWILDPLQDDTNRDGISDGNTCFVNSQTGVFVCPDTDGDGTPDVWDDDLDNDGVLNRDDISPYSVMPYRNQIEVDITGQYSNAAVYVDVQVQPQTTAHLRYSTTWLDWPNDSKGQIQDLDNSTEDVRLIPVLEITSPVSPHSLPATVSPPSPTRIRRAIDCGRRCSRWARGVASAPSTPASPLPLKK